MADLDPVGDRGGGVDADADADRTNPEGADLALLPLGLERGVKERGKLLGGGGGGVRGR